MWVWTSVVSGVHTRLVLHLVAARSLRSLLHLLWLRRNLALWRTSLCDTMPWVTAMCLFLRAALPSIVSIALSMLVTMRLLWIWAGSSWCALLRLHPHRPTLYWSLLILLLMLAMVVSAILWRHSSILAMVARRSILALPSLSHLRSLVILILHTTTVARWSLLAWVSGWSLVLRSLDLAVRSTRASILSNLVPLSLSCLISLVELLNNLGLVALHPLEVYEFLQVPIICLFSHSFITFSSLCFITRLLLVILILSGSFRLLWLVLSLLLLSVISLLGLSLSLQGERLHRFLLSLCVGIRCRRCWIFMLQLGAKYWYMVLIRVLGIRCSIRRCIASFGGDAWILSSWCLRILVLRLRWRRLCASLLDLLLAAELLRH